MKNLKILICTISFLCLIVSMSAKNSYYYYNGKRIPLWLSDDSVSVYSNDSYSIKEINRASDEKSVTTSIEYIINGEDGKTVKMTNRFYVQLFDSIEDVPILEDLATKTNTTILGRVPYMSDWYELKVSNSSINNSLEMSNYFYETSLFKNIDPGFIFNFTPSVACVTDNHYSSQWGLPKINACDAWDITKGSPDVKIAVIDAGVNNQHTEFVSTQFVDYYDCVNHNSSYHTYTNHGTKVCGVIAADHNHAYIAGVAPMCKIMPISFYVSDTLTAAANIASGFAWAVSHGADIINCSWGDDNCCAWLHSAILESAIQNALTNGRAGKGCVVVFAAGNQNSPQVDYPGSAFAEILTVGAMDNNNYRWSNPPLSGSCYGYQLDLVAPGKNIRTTTYTDYNYYDAYDNVTGTSFAAPYVSGTAGLILSVNPYLTRQEVTDIIESTAQKAHPINVNYYYSTTEGRPNGTWDLEMGYGLVDAHNAVRMAKERYIQGPDRMCDTAKYYLIRPLQAGETVQWSIDNGQNYNPWYSIIGSNNQDTVTVVCEEAVFGPFRDDENDNVVDSRLIGDPFTPPINNTKLLSATISNGSTSDTYTKNLRHHISITPIATASNTSPSWPFQTQRTFNVTNCDLIPDSLIRWTVQKIRLPLVPGPNQIVQTSYYYGKTLTYGVSFGAFNPGDTLIVYATNLYGECGPHESNVFRFVVSFAKLNLSSENVDNELLNIFIVEENEESQYVPAQLNTEKRYTLELWHNIYGLCTIPVLSATTQMNIAGLPSGVCVLLLKENGEVVAQTKVLIQ